MKIISKQFSEKTESGYIGAFDALDFGEPEKDVTCPKGEVGRFSGFSVVVTQ
jgi:hypothetical protein